MPETQTENNRAVVIDKKNEGSIKARQRGMDESSGEYVMFVDADDWTIQG